jgi:sugar lactone lactonase YvrE
MLIFKRFSFIILNFLFLLSFSQNRKEVWKDHFSFSQGKGVATDGKLIYCISDGGLFTYNPIDNSTERFSKLNGLSDNLPIKLFSDLANKIICIVYKNSNVDFIVDGRIINYNAIKNNLSFLSKKINSVKFDYPFAYFACSFGIIKYDLIKNETKENYAISPSGIEVEIFDLEIEGDTIFASNKDNLLFARKSNPLLADYNNWKIFPGIQSGKYVKIVKQNKTLLLNKNSQSLCVYKNGLFSVRENYNNAILKDVILIKDRIFTIWDKYINPGPNQFASSRYTIYDLNLNQIKEYDNYTVGAPFVNPTGVAIKDDIIYFSDASYGFIKTNLNVTSAEAIYINGPASNSINKLVALDGNLYIAPVSYNEFGGSNYIGTEVSLYSKNSWKTISKLPADTLFDFCNLTIDPIDNSHIYVATWGVGLTEFKNGKFTKLYNEKNSSQLPVRVADYRNLRTGASAFDKDLNLWVLNANVKQLLHVKKNMAGEDKKENWVGFDFSNVIDNPDQIIQNFIVTSKGLKIIPIKRSQGLIVFDDKDENGKAFSQPTKANCKILKKEENKGALPSNQVTALAEDYDGNVWIGTDNGLAVLYNPDLILKQEDGWDAQRLKLDFEGRVQFILDKEYITCITIDGANRKWYGTINNGVYCFSPDGYTQIYHFTAENSPLLSNVIRDIAIDNKTGEVFFGTDIGLISLKGEATVGAEDFKNTFVYPNPVRPEYTGNITISGLMDRTDIKITDVSGNLVFKGVSAGGQLLWDGKNFDGNRVATGVYYLMLSAPSVTEEDKRLSEIKKLLFIH